MCGVIEFSVGQFGTDTCACLYRCGFKNLPFLCVFKGKKWSLAPAEQVNEYAAVMTSWDISICVSWKWFATWIFSEYFFWAHIWLCVLARNNSHEFKIMQVCTSNIICMRVRACVCWAKYRRQIIYTNPNDTQHAKNHADPNCMGNRMVCLFFSVDGDNGIVTVAHLHRSNMPGKRSPAEWPKQIFIIAKWPDAF